MGSFKINRKVIEEYTGRIIIEKAADHTYSSETAEVSMEPPSVKIKQGIHSKNKFYADLK